LAAAGQRGTIDGLDYRGVSVLAAYRPIQITPELNWGLVVKRDRKELFAPLYHELYQAALLGLVGIAIFVLVTMVVARNVARPLRALAQTAAHVSGGDLSARAPVSTDDEVGMLAGTFNEMVQRIQDWEEVMVRQERLAALGQLIATVSHELRNPLGTIRTSFFVIAKQIRAAELGVTPALDRIDRSITRCDGIISDLLDYSSNQPVQTKPTEIDPWLASTLDEYETPPQIELCRNLAAGVTIPLDPDRFHRCMLNLLSNACESIESGKGRVTVASCVEDGHVAIRVADTGCGIPADQIHKIFEPLYSTKSFGVGLGVPIIKQIVDRHNGSIEVESQPGRGTTFVVRLPLDLHQEKESSHE
jgi:signal transduction histidine kinase